MLVGVSFLVWMLASQVEAHGGLISPRSRNWVAREDGSEQPRKGIPAPEYCWHCLNDNTGLCGKINDNDYDDWVDSVGIPMPWSSQATWKPGQVVQIDFEITANHWGHIELHACPKGRQSTQRCLDQYPLEFVEDVSHGMPKDRNFPERGYLTGGESKFTMKFRLPSDLEGSQVLLQWKYITANSCNPPGYKDYFSGVTTVNKSFNSVLGPCTLPYPSSGKKGPPEQFWNCAEVSISTAAPVLPPLPVPVPVIPPTPIRVPAVAPVRAPVVPPVRVPPVVTPVQVPVPTPAVAPVRLVPVVPPVPPVAGKPSTTDTGCCSFDFKTCITNRYWCGTTENECRTCESVANWLPNGSLKSSACLPRFRKCDPGTCCPGLVCFERSSWYSQCLPPSEVPVSTNIMTKLSDSVAEAIPSDGNCLMNSQNCKGGTCCPGLTCQKMKFWHLNPQCVAADE